MAPDEALLAFDILLEQRAEIEQLRTQLAQLRSDNEELREQNRGYSLMIEGRDGREGREDAG